MRARLEPQPMGYAFSYIRKAGPNANGARTEGWGTAEKSAPVRACGRCRARSG